MPKILLWIGVLVSVVVTGGAGVASAQEGPAITEVRAGDALMTQGKYREAAAQYEAAYAVDPVLVILDRLIDAYRLAGDERRVQILSRRAASLRQVERPYVPQPPGPPAWEPPPPNWGQPQPMFTYTRPRLRPGQQLINSGVGMLVSGYVIAAIGGGITAGYVDYNNNGCFGCSPIDTNWYGAGGMLFIPIVGPFASLAFEHDARWAIPWTVLDGGLQLGGLAMIIAGAAVRAHHLHHPPPVSLAPYTNATTKGLVLSGSF